MSIGDVSAEPCVLHLENGYLSRKPGINVVCDEEGVRQFVSSLSETGPLFMYLHGGLNSHENGIKQARRLYQAMRLQGQEHLFVAWESWVTEVVTNRFTSEFTDGTRNLDTFADCLTRVVRVLGRSILKEFSGATLTAVDGESVVNIETLSLLDDDDGRVHQRALRVMRAVRQDEEFDAVATDLGDLLANAPSGLDHAEVVATDIGADDVPPDVKLYARQLQDAPDALSDYPLPESGAQTAGLIGGPLGDFGELLVTSYKVVRELVERRGPHDHGFRATLTEAVLRHAPYLKLVTMAGQFLWQGMKDIAQNATEAKDGRVGGVLQVLHALNERYSAEAPKRLFLVGHSAGCIFLLRVLEAAKAIGLLEKLEVDVVMMAPACTIGAFEEAVNAELLKPERTRVYLLHDEVERADAVLSGAVEGGKLDWLRLVTDQVYPHSLLYLVAGLFEKAQPGTPILGLDRYLEAQLSAGGPMGFLRNQRALSLTSVNASLGRRVTARRHGGFPFDDYMVESLSYLWRAGVS